MKTIRLILAAALLAFAAPSFSGCQTTPQRATYQAAVSTTITVETALRAYNVFAKQGKTTIEQNRKVKDAFEKYQAAMVLVCDAGAIYAASAGTNSPAASLALQQAIANANQTMNDFYALLRAFGVKL